MSANQGNVAGRGRHDRLIKEDVHDPYMARGKLAEPTVCMDCGAVFSKGRWQWATQTPADAHQQRCPACQRIHDKVPAGYLDLSGSFLEQHRDEIMHLVHNKVESQKAQHPVKRLMAVEDQKDGGVQITFTDMHLPRGVGEAIQRAYEGDLDIQYTEGSGIVRVYWKR
jgi:NMD protein affecting ribosome stability and mRNA decay